MPELTCADVLAYAKKHLACDSAINWLKTLAPGTSFRVVWAMCPDPDWQRWLLEKIDFTFEGETSESAKKRLVKQAIRTGLLIPLRNGLTYRELLPPEALPLLDALTAYSEGKSSEAALDNVIADLGALIDQVNNQHWALKALYRWTGRGAPGGIEMVSSETRYVSALALAQQYPADAVEARLKEVMGLTDAVR